MNERTKKVLLDYIPIAITFAGIIICAIIYNQQFIKVFPVCFSLLIMLFSVRANKIGFLLGAANCVVYIIGYLSERLYGSVFSTAFSAAIQVASFFIWNKNAYKQATIFRSLKKSLRIIVSIGLLVSWGVTCFVLIMMGGKQVYLEGANLVLGIVVPIAAMFAFVEAPVLNILCQVINVAMWISIVSAGELYNLTYLISAVFNLYMVIRTTITWFRIYNEQKTTLNNN